MILSLFHLHFVQFCELCELDFKLLKSKKNYARNYSNVCSEGYPFIYFVHL